MDFWLRYGLALLVLMAMLGGFAALGRTLRRVRLNRNARRIEIVESAMLAPQAALHIVRVDRRELLVGTGEIAKIAQLEEPIRT
jgi:flagellar biogenesis protein FliO